MRSVLTGLPVATVLVLFLARLAELGAKRGTIPGRVAETWTLQGFVLLGSLMCLAGIAEYFWSGGGFAPWNYGLGLVLGLASIGIRRSAISALGRFWSLHVEIRDQHELVTSGPFGRVRHPVYLSMILELLGVVVLLRAWVTLVALAIPFGLLLHARIRREEAAMEEKFGDTYAAYARRTGALLPRLW